ERFIPLHQLITTAYQRYNRPIILSETSHPKEDRPLWINHIAKECAIVIKQGMPFWGVCWYPVIDRPDWDHLNEWHQSVLWDAGLIEDCLRTKALHIPTAAALLHAQQKLSRLVQ